MGASNYTGLAHPKPPPRSTERRAERKADETHERKVYAAVDRRDGLRCQLTGRRGNAHSVDPLDRIHHHHIEQLGRDGGETETFNVVSVIRDVHNLIHQNRIVVRGNADEELVWTLKHDAVLELFGAMRIPDNGAKFWARRIVRWVADDSWEEFIRGQARIRTMAGVSKDDH